MRFILQIFVFVTWCTTSVFSTWEVLQTVQGTIGAENYTYYRVTRPGRLLIELKTLQGDADLYITAKTDLKPTFENIHNDFESSSCGLDSVEIDDSYPRPFGVGVYGHFIFEVSTFELSVIQLPELEEWGYDHLTEHYYNYEAADHLFLNYDASDYMYRDVKGHLKKHSKTKTETASSSSAGYESYDEEESAGSIIWQILLTFLKVIFEVIL
ncbi:UPF0669 protein C6orf120 homolog [Dreissena polymorpha]|uniref:Uncharacterized protein n=1 Tax=Dreissena polymorpha TaxID=45954 RepID=A0A9D4L8A7_DREPO|nr:UPF0669 protein C6orf120 homolog [Dreissena polymorpha]KAH3853134.1 hypothetical protein DPMN_095656 [Dreissena polymorpha]